MRALVRPAAKLSGPLWSQVDVFKGDLRASRNLTDAFDGVDALVHLAAQVTGGEDLQFAATVVGTERLLGAMAQSPCRRVVLAGSMAIYDWDAVGRRVHEDSPAEESELYDRDGYSISKVWQERVARRLASEHRWELTVLRPGFIWGRGNEYVWGVGQQVGPVQMVFGPTRQLSMTHVENCASAFAEATENPAAAGRTFNVVDDDCPSAWRYAGEYIRRSGKGGVRLPVPYWIAKATTKLARWTSRKIFHGKGKLPSILVPPRFDARFMPARADNTALRETLNWRPALSLDESLRRTFAPTSVEQQAITPTLSHA